MSIIDKLQKNYQKYLIPHPWVPSLKYFATAEPGDFYVPQ